MLTHIIAKSKPRETLLQHTDEVLSAMQLLRDKYGAGLIPSEAFWQKSSLAALFHDTGKITGNFQDRIHGRVKHWDNHIRHEFFSGVLMYSCFPRFHQEDPIPLLAVFSHHKPLEDGLFQDNSHKVLQLNKGDFELLLQELRDRITNRKLEFDIPERVGEFLASQQTFNVFYRVFRQFYDSSTSKLTAHDRVSYIRLKAILNTADWSGSNHGLLGGSLRIDGATLQGKIIEKLIREQKIGTEKDFSWRDFQTTCRQREGHTIAIAPTGSGKTEAALLWAERKKADEKLIYLLPTRVTSNAIFQRLRSYFGKEETAVVHSSAFFYRKELEDEDNYHKGHYLMDKTFFKTVNVCTIDQVLTQGFNIGYWELKTFHLTNAWVIIDEIHLYAPYTLGLIIETICYLKEQFGTRFFIMTATMPQKLLNLLQETLDIPSEEIIRDQELLSEARNEFQTRDCLIDGIEPEITEALSQGLKVLIVVNTVDEAIRLYRKYKGIATESICYHSRFIQKDRLEKEKLILEEEQNLDSFLLVATQVVEVSLDIDFDILFTENAPIDAIIQRAGRVNRKRKKEHSQIVVCREQEVTREVIYTEVEQVLERTFLELTIHAGQRLTENDLLQLVDDVYRNYDVIVHPSYQEARDAYSRIQRKHHFVKDNLERDEVYTREGLDTVSVIPDSFEERLVNAEPIEKAKYELSIRRKKLFSLLNKGFRVHQDNDKRYTYLGCHYTFEVGLEYKPTKIFLSL